MKRSSPSDDHKKAWKQFYDLLTIRSQVYMFFKFITTITLLGTFNKDELNQFSSDDNIKNCAIPYDK